MNNAADAFLGFIPLSDEVFLLNPGHFGDGADASGPSSSDPTTVILFSWGNAVPKHVAKYADGYRGLFPTARIILVLSSMLDVMFTAVPRRSKAMLPVIDAALHSHGSLGDNERILIQVMSNTGGVSLVAMLVAYNAMSADSGNKTAKAKTFPHALLVCDSMPGGDHFVSNVSRWAPALAQGIGGYLPWPMVVTRGLCYAFLWANYAKEWIMGQPSVAQFSIAAMLKPEISSTAATRLHLYSDADQVIWWEDVEKFIATAQGKGYKCLAEMFEGTPHVGHMKQYPERYWSVIERVWRSAVGIQP